MKLGLLTAPFPDTPLMQVADWASSAGFEALEIACWPKSTGPTRRYAGTTHIDVAKTSKSQAREIVAALGERGYTIAVDDYRPASGRDALLAYVDQTKGPDQIRGLFRLAMALPAYQLN